MSGHGSLSHCFSGNLLELSGGQARPGKQADRNGEGGADQDNRKGLLDFGRIKLGHVGRRLADHDRKQNDKRQRGSWYGRGVNPSPYGAVLMHWTELTLPVRILGVLMRDLK